MRVTSIRGWVVHARANAQAGSLTHFLGVLWAGSLALHLGVVLLFIRQPIALDDMFQYDMLARSLSQGDGYRWYARADVEILRPYLEQFLDLDSLHFPEEGLLTAFRSPGYPFFLAGLYTLVPAAGRFALARLIQAALMASLAPLAVLLASRCGFSRLACLRAGIGAGLYPILLFYPIGLASEDLYIPLGMLSLVLLLEAARRVTWKWVLLAGLCCGVMVLTRAIMAGFVLLACLWMGRYSPLGMKAAGILAAAAIGIYLPWGIRNSIVMHRLAFVENSLGYNLFVGYHPAGDGGFVSEVAILPLHILDDAERDRTCLQEALRFIREDPHEAARRIVNRAFKFLGPEDREFFYFYSNNQLGPIPQPALALVYLLLVVPWASTGLFGLVGLWLPPPAAAKSRGAAALVVALLAGYGLPHLLILSEPRFHLALVPVLVPFAAHGWEMAARMRGGIFAGRRGMGLAASAVLFGLAFTLAIVSTWSRLFQVMMIGGNELYFPY